MRRSQNGPQLPRQVHLLRQAHEPALGLVRQVVLAGLGYQEAHLADHLGGEVLVLLLGLAGPNK